MVPTKMTDHELASHDLPMELRRAWTVHRNEDLHPSLMLTGATTGTEQDDVIPPYLLRQNLVVPAYPFRTSCVPGRQEH